MMAVTGGRERTRDEYQKLLAAAGLKLDKITPTQSHTGDRPTSLACELKVGPFTAGQIPRPSDHSHIGTVTFPPRLHEIVRSAVTVPLRSMAPVINISN